MKKISVSVAAVVMGKSEQFVRRGLIAGKFPFGTAVEGEGGRYSFYISPKLFMEYTGCTAEELEDSSEQELET